MVIKHKKLNGFLLFVIIIPLFFSACKTNSPQFIRKNLKTQKGTEIIKKTDKFKPVNNGVSIKLRGSKLIKINSQYRGKIGIFLYTSFESLNPDLPISFEMYFFESNKKKKRLHFVKSNDFKSNIIEKFELNKKGENIIIKFSGYGKVFISNPIVYEILDNKKRENIFVIGIDTFRFDMLSKKINNNSITPNIDKFIKDSVLFENCYAQSSWTLPSFMSFFTSLYEFNHLVGIRNILKPNIKNLIEYFSKKFITIAFHGGLVMSKRWGQSRGFDYYKEFKFAGPLYPYGGKSLFEKAIETLDRGNFPKLFMFLHTYQIHDPYTPPEGYLYKINPNPLAKKGDTVNSGKPEKTYMRVDNKIKKSLKELYQAEILAFDDFFGNFITYLKKKKLYNSATIVLVSDHGEEFFEHGGWGHSHSLYNELIRVPLIIKFPNNKYSNIIRKQSVSIIDILPTILDFKEIDIDEKK